MTSEIVRPDMTPVVDQYDELPLDTCKLPSKGRIYSEEHPLHLKDFVEYRAMGTEQENILATPALIRQGTVLNVLIKSCLTDKGIETDSLLMGDKAALLLSIRSSGFGTEYKCTTQCKFCQKEQPHVFDLSKIEIKPLGVDPIREGENLFEYTLPLSKKKVKFSIPTDKIDLEIMQAQEARKKSLKSAMVDTMVTDRLLFTIKEIGGNDDPDFISRFVHRSMRALDSRSLRSYMAKIEPDVLVREEVSCRHCGESSSRHVTMGYEFFWPSASDE